MENTVEYSKKLCMTELRVSHTHYSAPHYYDAGAGKLHSSFCYLVKGGVTLTTVGKSIRMEAGSLFYIPEGIRYHSVWTGSPDVEFYSLDMISRRTEMPIYSMSHIPSLSTPETGTCFAEIFTLFSTGDRLCKIRALGKYYEFYAAVLPYLSPEPPIKYNPALLSALQYIEQHAERDFSMGELAAHCCISESRLYHIFKSQLGTSPVHYRNELRVENAAGALRTGDESIDRIAESCGFHSTAYFRETFRAFTGLTPSEYRAMVSK